MSERQRTSDLLLEVAAKANPHVAIGGLCDLLGDRAYGILLLILAILAGMPSIPGVSGILGGAIVLVSSQILVGQPQPWLPNFIASRRIPAAIFRRGVERVAPLLRRLERLCQPRLQAVVAGWPERLVGLTTLVLGLIIFLPIPVFGNIPPALAIVVLALGFIERDGVVILLGLFGAGAAIVLTWALSYAALMALAALVHGWLSWP